MGLFNFDRMIIDDAGVLGLHVSEHFRHVHVCELSPVSAVPCVNIRLPCSPRGLQQPAKLHRHAQDENGEFNTDVARGVKAPERGAAAPGAAAAAPLLLTNGPSHPLALGGPTLGLTTPPARPPSVTDIVYLVRCLLGPWNIVRTYNTCLFDVSREVRLHSCYPAWGRHRH